MTQFDVLSVCLILQFSDMTDYKLTYWHGSGLGVPVRMAFHVGGIKFEDVRFDDMETWEKIKPKTPLGQVPVLEFDGKIFCQSNALLRFAAKQAGIAANATPIENLTIDEVCYLIDDAYSALPMQKDLSKDELKERRTEWMNGPVQRIFTYIESIIARSNSGFVSPVGISIADLKLYGFFTLMACGYFDFVATNLADRFPRVSAVLAKVRALPSLAAYFEANQDEEAHYTQPPKA